uniref:Uncharacterized protein n=1 Tax=Rhodosorus marinus TaxID=101924 RepID=A0A7S0G0D4_9RHOD
MPADLLQPLVVLNQREPSNARHIRKTNFWNPLPLLIGLCILFLSFNRFLPSGGLILPIAFLHHPLGPKLPNSFENDYEFLKIRNNKKINYRGAKSGTSGTPLKLQTQPSCPT